MFLIAIVTLVVLKLTGVITWSWWWVLSPLWISAASTLLGICAFLLLAHWHTRKQMRLAIDYLESEGRCPSWFMGTDDNPDTSGGTEPRSV